MKVKGIIKADRNCYRETSIKCTHPTCSGHKLKRLGFSTLICPYGGVENYKKHCYEKEN